MTKTTNIVPCPDPECNNGTITVYDAYAPNPLLGKSQKCDCCFGLGLVQTAAPAALSN